MAFTLEKWELFMLGMWIVVLAGACIFLFTHNASMGDGK